MSYSEENGQVVLRMSREDWEELDACVKLVQIFEHRLVGRQFAPKAGDLRERLNSGNLNYTPYQVEERKS